ncbi:MAG: formate/nitrite family transporter [Candidatus Didemnitutus sp.]|nr:formate/nitrite family transporter [Candidatus Didemnitutus sp.]
MAEQSLSNEARAPAEIARRIEAAGSRKTQGDLASVFALSILGGAFIALGACFATIVWTHSGLGFGMARLMGGLVFSLGLILVVVAGAELFTGNVLLVVAWASRKVTLSALLRNWSIVFLGNFLGAVATAIGIYLTRQWSFVGGGVGAAAIDLAAAKVSHGFVAAFFLGAFCNALVCLAVWLCLGARSLTDQILAIVPPITAFVAMGFEHSIANMYFIPIGLLLAGDAEALALAGRSAADLGHLTWLSFAWKNLLPVTLGNIVGGGVMVGAFYWFIYLRPRHSDAPAS